MSIAVLPTRRDEAWRYSDLEAVASVWPVPDAEIIEVPAGQSLARVIVQDAATDAVAIRDYRVILRAGATATFHVLNVGGQLGRVTIDVTCHEGSHFELGAAMLGGGDQTLEIVTTLNHIEPNATSNQVVRSVLGGRATGSYLGKVAVARHAQKTDASQSVKAMLLTRTATANAKPELEIYADDVKCAHGATVGELDANALFYLGSRGIAPAEAKAMLLRAFIGSVFEGIADVAGRERVEAAAQTALERMLSSSPLPLASSGSTAPRAVEDVPGAHPTPNWAGGGRALSTPATGEGGSPPPTPPASGRGE